MGLNEDAYIQAIRGLNVSPHETGQALPRLYLFTSFDLVGSTKFKADQPITWPIEMRRFYDLAKNEFLEKCAGTRIWKYAGDEVLFYTQVSTSENLAAIVRTAHRALRAIASALQNTAPGTPDSLSVKGTCWVGDCVAARPGDMRAAARELVARNLMFPAGDLPESSSFDFIGLDIDAGFRVARRSAKQLLVLSAELAWLLLELPSGVEAKEIRIADHVQLPGIWEERHYPICAYSDDWPGFESQLSYDDRFRSPTIAGALKSSGQSGSEYLTRALRDAKQMPHAETLRLLITAKNVETNDDTARATSDALEVHCVAVCRKSDGTIFVAKRAATKPLLPDTWEFGCARLRAGQGFFDAIQNDYKQDFGLTLSISTPECPKPIATYQMQKGGMPVCGIVFVCKVEDPAPSEVNYSPSKHSEIRWISPTDPPEDVMQRSVPDMERILAIVAQS